MFAFLQVAFMRGDTRPDMESLLTRLDKKIATGKPANKLETCKHYKKQLEDAKKLADEADFTMPAAYEPMSSETARLFLTPVYAGATAVTTWTLNKFFGENKKSLEESFNNLPKDKQEKLINAINSEGLVQDQNSK